MEQDVPNFEGQRSAPKPQNGVQTHSIGTSRRASEMMLEFAALAVQARNRHDLFKELASRLQWLTGCNFVNFSLHDPDQNCMLTHFWREDRESGEFDAFSVDDCISGQVWTTQQPISVADIEHERRFPACALVLRKHGVHSYTMLPMSTPARRYGALGLGRDTSGTLEVSDVEFLCRVAQVAALALENEEIHRTSVEQQQRLRSLVTISRELSSCLDPEKLVPIILDNLRQIIHYDHAVLALIEEDGKALQMYGVDVPTWEPLLAQGQRIPMAQALSARAIATRGITFLSAADLNSMQTPLAAAIRESGIQSVCNVPLCSASRVWGSLNLGSVQRGAFSQQDGEYLQQISGHIAAALENGRAYCEIAQLKERLAGEKRYLENEINIEKRWGEIVGNSATLKRVLDHASIVANTDSTVLITGETGTGKERLAQAIHNMSRRQERNFIKLNCAAIPTGLLESELFGHEKGAFTGAVSQKIGRLELADKGTLFLDEVGEIPLELQPKLLRVLQDQEFERLGGIRTIRVDVRLIAATNRDLSRAIEEKEFRRDLFYRLHVFPLHIPALRDRREDIPLLVRHFVEKSAARLNKRIETIPDQAIEAMLKWSWPGNIRELENFIERSVILSPGNVLHVPLAELQREMAGSDVSSDGTLRSKEREHIIEVLRRSRGLLSGPSGAAARLGLKRTTLQYKMQKLGISRLDYLS